MSALIDVFELVIYGQLSRIRPAIRVPVARVGTDASSTGMSGALQMFGNAVALVKDSAQEVMVGWWESLLRSWKETA
jgi:hypothetical protein